MTRDDVQYKYPDSKLLFLEEVDFDESILGVDNNPWYKPPQKENDEPENDEPESTERVVYSVKKILEILEKSMEDDPEPDGMTAYGKAREYFDFNIVGAYVGVQTPVFVEDEDDF